MLIAAVRSRLWLAGQAVGWFGFVVQIVAVALAPLSLVQAFAAGGLALSVPLSSAVFRHRITRRQLAAVAIMAASLAVLPIGLRAPAVRVATDAVLATALVLGALVGAAAVRFKDAAVRAVVAGVLYGVADAAIKADAVGVRLHGIAALLSVWTLLAVLGTLGGFLSFQAALRDGEAIAAISLMTALAALTALVFGVAAFANRSAAPFRSRGSTYRDRIRARLCPGTGARAAGRRRSGTAATATGRQRLTPAAGRGSRRRRRHARCARRRVTRRDRSALWPPWPGWLSGPPRVANALPLLQLAGFDAQPLPRVIVAWVLAGVAFGVLAHRMRPLRRAGLATVIALLVLLFASDASLALARNDRLSDVLSATVPGLGAWLEAALFALGAVLPGSRGVRMPRAVWRVIRTNPLLTGRPGWCPRDSTSPGCLSPPACDRRRGGARGCRHCARGRPRGCARLAVPFGRDPLSVPIASPTLPALVTLPAGYDGNSDRYPVIYVLHGLPADTRESPQRLHRPSGFVRADAGDVVAPQGSRAENSDREYLDESPTEN